MSTIVEYTDTKPPENRYPWRIISPSRSSPCCFSEMEGIGEVRHEERWEYVYKRCKSCGFTVQMILHEVADTTALARLRTLLDRAFRRPALDG